MYKDYYHYDHPALFLYLVEQTACGRAWRIRGPKPGQRRRDRGYGNRRVRRAIKQYLNTGSKPRIRSRAAGNSWDII